MVPHLKRLHLCNDERKSILREAIKSDNGLFMALEEMLKVLGQWMCGRCMSIQAVSRACQHPDGLIRVTDEAEEVESHCRHSKAVYEWPCDCRCKGGVDFGCRASR